MAQTPKADPLLEALTTPRSEQHASKCKLHIAKNKMNPEQQEALDRAIELVRADDGQGRSKAYSSSWLTGILRNNGYSISTSTIQRHVNGECPCERLGE